MELGVESTMCNNFITSETAAISEKPSLRISNVINGPCTKLGTGIIGNLAKGNIVGIAGKSVVLSTVVYDSKPNQFTDNTKSLHEIYIDLSNTRKEMNYKLIALAKEIQIYSRKRCSSVMIPLKVEFRERYHGVGLIPDNRLRRDNIITSDSEILAARAIDRALRPVIPVEHFIEGNNSDIAITCS